MPNHTPDRTPHEQELLNLLGKRMRRKRILQELTHERLAEKSGISQRSIQAMQAGQMNIRFSSLARIMKALGLKSWDDFLPHWDDVSVSEHSNAPKAAKKNARKATKKAPSKKSVKPTNMRDGPRNARKRSKRGGGT